MQTSVTRALFRVVIVIGLLATVGTCTKVFAAAAAGAGRWQCDARPAARPVDTLQTAPAGLDDAGRPSPPSSLRRSAVA